MDNQEENINSLTVGEGKGGKKTRKSEKRSAMTREDVQKFEQMMQNEKNKKGGVEEEKELDRKGKGGSLKVNQFELIEEYQQEQQQQQQDEKERVGEVEEEEIEDLESKVEEMVKEEGEEDYKFSFENNKETSNSSSSESTNSNLVSGNPYFPTTWFTNLFTKNKTSTEKSESPSQSHNNGVGGVGGGGEGGGGGGVEGGVEGEKKWEKEYNYYLNLAKSQNLEAFSKAQVVYQGGEDKEGRPIIVFVANRVETRSMDMDNLFLYLLLFLDPIVEKDYVCVFLQTNFSSNNRPSFSWVKRVYRIFNRKLLSLSTLTSFLLTFSSYSPLLILSLISLLTYFTLFLFFLSYLTYLTFFVSCALFNVCLEKRYKKNLKKLYIVHPTFWLKTMLKLCKPFISNKFWGKLVYCEELSQLYESVPSQLVQLPTQVKSFRTTKKGKRVAIFGSSLPTALSNNFCESGVPLFMEQILVLLEKKGPETEGIFRVPGNHSEINQLKEEIEKGEEVEFEKREIHAVAGVFKLFLREMEEPLIPFSFYSPFLQVQKKSAKNVEEWVREAKELIEKMPLPNQTLLNRVLRLLSIISSNSSLSKMNSSNTAIVFSPNIIWCQDENPLLALQDSSFINSLIKNMIDFYSSLFPPSPSPPL